MGLKMMNKWTFFEKEDQVKDMNPPRPNREQVDNMELARKWGVMMGLASIMDDSDDDKVRHLFVDDSILS